MGKISVSWRRKEQGILLDVEIPEGVRAMAKMDSPYCFEDGEHTKAIVGGTYLILQAR